MILENAAKTELIGSDPATKYELLAKFETQKMPRMLRNNVRDLLCKCEDYWTQII